MTNDAIWLFAGGDMQKIAAEKIIGRGYKLILTDINPKCTCSKYADELIQLDTFDIEGNLKIAENLKNKYSIKAVLTVAADCHETVANVGKHLKLHVISPEVSNICRFKDKTRETLQNAGIPQPLFRKVSSIEEAKSVIREISLPVVLKATNNSGSRGFSVINNLSDLTDDVFDRAVSSGTTGYVLIEQLLVPLKNEIAEQSVETLWYNGEMYWLNWVDRLFRGDFHFFESISPTFYTNVPWGIELGHINPAIHEYNVRQKVYDLIYKAGIAIGMKNETGGHILKADIMLTENGPYIIELAPRLSGGWDSSMTTPMRGGDFVGGVISLALGDELDLKLWYDHFQYNNPNQFSTILALVSDNARDCIGRKFSIGLSFDRQESVRNAHENLVSEKYVI